MNGQRTMRRFAKWHIWLGWLAGFPILMWIVTGLVMVVKPIEEVRGEHLRIARAERPLPLGNPVPVLNEIDVAPSVHEIRTFMQDGRPVTLVTRQDGSVSRYDAATGAQMPAVDEGEARRIVSQQIRGGDMVMSAARFEADDIPFDFRRPMPVWQVALADGTHVYVGAQTGAIEAVRTRWWRVFDFMWGLHIMDLQTREDTSHPILILCAALAAIGALLGCILLFRRRKARVTP